MFNATAFFEQLGVDGTNDIFLHSGYRAFRTEGQSVGDVLDCIEGLQGDKATMLPAFNWRLVSPAVPFDVAQTPSIVGALTEAFRARDGVRRGLHPTHSCLARARFYDDYLATHGTSASPCDRLSPFAQFADRKVRIVLVNCTIDTMTYIHHFEELIHPAHYLRDEVETVTVIDAAGTRSEHALRRHRKLQRQFTNFLPALSAAASFRQASMGAVSGWSIAADDAAYVITKKFAENIYAST